MLLKTVLKKIIVFLFSFVIVFSINPEIFKFKFPKGSKQKIEAVIKGKLFQDKNLVSDYTQKYKTIRTIKDVDSAYSIIEDTYYFYNQNKLTSSKVLEVNDISTVNYKKDTSGKMILFTNSAFPTYRDVPVFPSQDIKPGQRWTATATEVQDLFQDKIVSEFPINVSYTFLGYEDFNNQKLAKFQYEHQVDITNNGYYSSLDSRILKIVGSSVTIMYFDNINGTRVKEIYTRHYSFVINFNGQNVLIEFIDNGERIWYPIELMDKDKIVDDIKKKLKDENIDDTDVQKDDKGIKLTLENIHFYPDSSEMLPGEVDRLKKIAKILSNYKDRGIMIIGHTTDKGTEEGRKRLSVERAKVVLDFLNNENAINIDKSSYGGRGGTEPIADNSTEEGMKKNRRVEIHILEE